MGKILLSFDPFIFAKILSERGYVLRDIILSPFSSMVETVDFTIPKILYNAQSITRF